MVLEIILVVALVLAAILTVAASRIMWSVIALAVTSAVLTMLMFRFDAPLAAVFELSVCAGLIPAIFISTISLTRRVTPEVLAARRREKLVRYVLLPVIVIIVAMLLLAARLPLDGVQPAATAEKPEQVRDLFWHVRQIDLVGQIAVLLGGAFAILALLKGTKRDQ
jgi:NADH-quinone oxidoreductase subunit J